MNKGQYDNQKSELIESETVEDQTDMTAAEIEKLLDRIEKMSPENRQDLLRLLSKLIRLMD